MKKRFIIFYVVTFCIVAGLSFAMPASSAILFYEDFEDALKMKNEWAIRPLGHGSQGLTTEQVRYGASAYKFSLTRHNFGDYREELMLTKYFIPNHGYQNFIIGDEYWIGYSIFLAEGYHSPTEPGTWGIVHHQYHGALDEPPICYPAEPGRNPLLSINTKSGDWVFNSIWDSRQCTPKSGNYGGGTSRKYGAFSTGQWYDFVINVKWSYGSNGFLKIWQNGVLVTDLTGGNCFNDNLGPFLRIGIYAYLDQDQTVTIYYDELRIGDSNSSYSEIAPRGSVKPSEPTSLKVEKITSDLTE